MKLRKEVPQFFSGQKKKVTYYQNKLSNNLFKSHLKGRIVSLLFSFAYFWVCTSKEWFIWIYSNLTYEAKNPTPF